MTFPTLTQFGSRVRFSREMKHITQDALAKTLGFNDRQTVSDIENGKRAVKADELAALSDALDQDVEFFIDPFNVVAEAQYAWRANKSLADEVLDSFEKTANGWVGMLRWLHEQAPDKEADLGFLGLRMNESTTVSEAQGFGEALARLLELGIAPANSLSRRVVDRLGIPVLLIDGPPGLQPLAISGAACRVGQFNLLLLNRRESAGWRHETLALELFHILTWDAMPPRRRESNPAALDKKVKQSELLAHAFAGGLLMPRESLDYFIEPTRANDVAHLADVADAMQVTTGALGRRLVALGRIDQLTRAALEDAQRPDNEEPPARFSLPFTEKLHTALDKGRLSARKAARTLGMPLPELTALFEAHSLRAPFDL